MDSSVDMYIRYEFWLKEKCELIW